MNCVYLLMALALAVAMTATKVDGNPHARHARAVAAASAPKPAAVAAGLTANLTVPQLLPLIVTNIQMGTVSKTGVPALDKFASAVSNITKIKTKLTPKQLATFGTTAVTSLSAATKATKANQAKLQTAVTNGLKVVANQNVNGVIKIIGNNANLLGAAKVVTPVLQKLLAFNLPSPAGMSGMLDGLGISIPPGINVTSLFNGVSAGKPLNVSSIASMIGSQPGLSQLNISSIMNTVNADVGAQSGQSVNVTSLLQQYGLPASMAPGAAGVNISSLIGQWGAQAGGSTDLSSLLSGMIPAAGR